jgi:RNA polymerase sigma factor (sigma-70 family)
MKKYSQSDFAEILVDKLIMESFPIERSPYYQVPLDDKLRASFEKLRDKVKWHINHSLSKRQKEVIKLYLEGKKQAEIACLLGIKQQVVNIYKHRAINKLKHMLGNKAVC